MNRLGLIVEREFLERVRKKSFILVTILIPILIAFSLIGPTFFMNAVDSKAKTERIVVIDNTPGRIIGTRLPSDSRVEFQLLPENTTLEEARQRYGYEVYCFGILVIGEDIIDNPGNLTLINNGASSLSVEDAIRERIQGIIRTERLNRYDVENINSILADANVHAGIQTLKNEQNQEMKSSSTGGSVALGFIIAFFIYMIIIIYGQMVLQSVIDEKQTRVLDVLITSCKPFELMMGKVLGIAMVAMLQILIWGGIIMLLVAFALPAIAASSGNAEILLGSIADVHYIGTLVITTILYIIGGFLFYASMYAAIGSAVDTPQDAAQFNSVIMLPIIIAIYVLMAVIKNPGSDIAFWFSMIPFTSPMVMMARIPAGIPTWEIVVSLAVLYVSFIILIWLAARIFRIGVFMHGKKPTWRDLGQWIKMK